MQYNIAGTMRPGGDRLDVLPRKYDCADRPRFTAPNLRSHVNHPGCIHPFSSRNVDVRIDHNGLQVWIVAGLPMQEQDACMCGDGCLDLVCEDQPIAALEVLLCQQDKGVSMKFVAIPHVQEPVEGYGFRQDR